MAADLDHGSTRLTGHFYKPIYKDRIKDGSVVVATPYYANGRMTRVQFTLFHVFIILNLLLVILLPWAYFVYFPSFLQYSVDQIGINGNTIKIYKTDIGPLGTNTATFSGDIRIPAWSIFPLPGGFGANTIELVTLGDERPLASISVPAASFMLNQEIVLKTTGTISLSDEQQKNVHDILAGLSSKDGLKNFGLKVKLNAPITSAGLTLYAHLPLHRDLPMDNAALQASFSADEISTLPASLGGLQLVWKSLQLLMDDAGLTASIGAAFENWSPLSLATIESTELYLGVQGTRAVKLSLANLGLATGFNKDFAPSSSLLFIDSQIDPKAVQSAIEVASQGSFGISIMGPIKVKGADFVEAITKDLSIDIPLATLLSMAPSLSSAIDYNAVQNILGDSSIDISVLADRVAASVGLRLPALSGIKPPKDVAFPYQTSISLYGSASKLITVNVNPVIVTSSPSGMTISTGATILPENSDAAATGLANALNPILATNPTSSSIGIKDLAFSTPGSPPFKWTQQFFGERVLTVGLPALDKESLLDTLTSPAMLETANSMLRLAVGPVSLAQLTDRPGFGASGNVKVTFAPSLPQLKINFGYLNADTLVEDVKLASLELPSGLNFAPSDSGTGINAALVLNRDAALPGKIQKAANALLKSGAAPSSVGLTGLAFGVSAANHIVTFSKLVVDINTDTILAAAQKLSLPALNLALAPGMVKLLDADVSMPTSNSLAVTIGSTIQNPTTFSISLGTVALKTLLNEKPLAGLGLAPISLGLGTSSAQLGLTLTPSSGGNGLKEDVATFAKAFLAGDRSLAMPAGVTGLVLSPKGVSSGPAIIDQFQNIDFSVASGYLINMLSKTANTAAASSSPLDISALIPSGSASDLLKKFAPTIQFVQLQQMASSHIAAGADVKYTNPLALSASLPYLSLTTSLDGAEAIDIQISSLALARKDGVTKPRLVIGFQHNLKDKVAKLVSDLTAGKLTTSLGLSKVTFGSSSSDFNDLLSLVSLDVTNFAAPLIPGLSAQLSDLLKSIGATLTLEKRQATAPANNTITVNLPLGIQATLTSLAAEFKAGKVISTGIGASLKLPFPVDINMPYFGVALGLDDAHFVDVSAGLVISGTNPTTQISTDLKITDDDIIDGKINAIVDAIIAKSPLPGKISIGGIMIGASAADSNDALSSIKVAVPLANLVGGAVTLPAIDPAALVKSLAIQLNKVGMSILPAKTIDLQVALGISLPFAVTLKGLGYVGANAGVDSIEILKLSSSGLSLSPETKALSIDAKTVFPSSSAAQNKVSTFADNLIHHFGETTEVLYASGLAFGYDAASSFNFLNKRKIEVASKDVLNNANLNTVMGSLGPIDVNGLIAKAFVSSLSLDASPSSTMLGEVVAGLSNFTVATNINIPYAGLSVTLDKLKFVSGSNSRLLDFALTKPLVVQNKDNNVVATVGNTLAFSSNPMLKAGIAAFVKNVMDGKNVTDIAGATGVTFGASKDPADIIDVFATVDVSTGIQPLIDQAKPYITKLLNSTGGIAGLLKTYKIAPKLIELDVLDEATLITNAKIDMDLPLALNIKLPFVGAGVKFNDGELITNDIALTITNKNIDAKAHLNFADNRTSIQSIFTMVGNVVWGINANYTDSVTLYGAGAGYSKADHISLLEGVNINVPLNSYIQYATVHGVGVKIEDLYTAIVHEGISAVATMTNLGFPVALRNSIVSEAKWALKGTTKPEEFVTLMTAYGTPFTLPQVPLLLAPPEDPKQMVPPMREALFNIATFASYGDNARLGFLTMVGTNGKKFSRFDSAYFNGPNFLTAPASLNIDCFMTTREPAGNGDGVPLNFTTVVSVPNNSPLHLNAGQLAIYSESYDPDNPLGYHVGYEDLSVLFLVADQDIIIRNFNEGGNATSQAGPVTQAQFRTYDVLGSPLDWAALFSLAFGSDEAGYLFRSIIRTKVNGQWVKWFDDLNYYMEDSHFTAMLTPHFDKIEEHLKYRSDIPVA
ncbi:hypothetical protein HDU91_002252 [Kappamyces sp. JEL0680]|nr:hypothetical protein HDU91_002252 [Kappamyces sp. JEL0680]